MARKPKPASLPALQIVQRALCRAGPDEELPDGRQLWETKEKEARRILEALKDADPVELRSLFGL